MVFKTKGKLLMQMQPLETKVASSSLQGKITLPDLRGVVHRQRLFSIFDAARDVPIWWITGPGGAGKSTLVRSYIEYCNLPCLWYKFDSRDSDPSSFFYYLSRAVQEMLGESFLPLPLLTAEYIQDVRTFTLRFFEKLYSFFDGPVLLVFDNYQEIPQKSSLHRIFQTGLEWIPEEVIFLFTSRTAPAPEFAKPRSIHGMTLIGEELLRLNKHEAQEIARSRKLPLPENWLEVLLERTKGWAAGFVLMLEAFRQQGFGDVKSWDTPEVIAEYFAGELFDRADQNLREFLLKTCFLPSLTTRSAQDIVKNSKTSTILERLHRNNFFTEKHPGKVPRYTYHPLFREFLQTRAKQKYSLEQIARIQYRSAEIAQEDDPESAVELFAAAGDWPKVIELISRQAPVLLQQGRVQVLRAWIHKLPQQMRERNPWMCYWHGVALQPFSGDAIEFFRRSLHMFRQTGDSAGLLLSWSGLVDTIGQSYAHGEALEELIEQFGEIYEGAETCPSDQIRIRVAASMVMALVLRMKDPVRVEPWAAQVLQAEGMPDTFFPLMQTHFYLCFHALWRGELDIAHFRIIRFMRFVSTRDAPQVGVIYLKLTQAFSYLITGNSTECQKAVERGLQLSKRTGVRLLDNFFLGHAAANCLGRGEIKEAEGYLAGIKGSSLRTWDESFTRILKARKAQMEGNHCQANQHVLLAEHLEGTMAMPFSGTVTLLFRSMTLHGLGEIKGAWKYLIRAENLAKETGSRLLAFYVDMFKALLKFWERDFSEAEKALFSALRSGKNCNFDISWLDCPQMTAELFAFALDRGIDTEYVRSMIRRRNLVPRKPPQDVQAWPWKFKIFALGTFAIEKDEAPCAFSGRWPKTPLKLLKLIVALEGKEIHSQELVHRIWPEAEGDAGQSAFSTTLSRLRTILGNAQVLELRDGLLSINPFCCWVDVWSFERHLRNAFAAGKDRGLRKREFSFAFNLYRGHLLAGEGDESWILPLRARLRTKFEQCVRELASDLEYAGKWKEAADLYAEALERDELPELFYQGLIRCYGKLGLHSEALSAYTRCCETLFRRLGTHPSNRTELLLKNFDFF